MEKNTFRRMDISQECLKRLDDGEELTVPKITVYGNKGGSTNFRLFWYRNFFSIISSLIEINIDINTGIKMLEFIFENVDKDNKIYFSKSAAQRDTGLSRPTINKYIDVLLEVDVIRIIANNLGVDGYFLNPHIIYDGHKNNTSRMSLLVEFYGNGKYKQVENGEKIIYERNK